MTDTYRPFEDEPSQRGYIGSMGPSPAISYDSRFGGPNPWESSLKDYIQLGAPNMGDRPFEGLGKTNVAASMPLAPYTPNADPTPQPVGAPQPGLFQAFGQGLTQLAMDTVIPLDLITSMAGSGIGGDIERNLSGAVGALGGLLDGVFDFMPVIDFLPGGGSIEGTYDRLPEDELKRQYDLMLATAHPEQRMEYMKQYLDQRGSEIARLNGFGGEFAELAGPSASFSEQLRRIIFGSMMAPQGQIRKMYAGSGLRDIENTILNRDDSELPPELVEMKKRLNSGEMTRDEFIEELSIGEFAWTQDTGSGGFFINLAMDIVSDPLIWASVGMGTAVKGVANGSIRLATLRVAQAARKAGSISGRRMADDLARQFKMKPEEILNSSRDDISRARFDWAKQHDPQMVQEAVGSMSRAQRVSYHLDPIIQPVAAITNEIDSMFGMFGTSHVAKRMSAFRGAKGTEGFVRAFGVKRTQNLQRFMGPEKFDDFTSYLGIAVANLGAKLSQKVEVDSLLAHNRAVDVASDASPLLKSPDYTPAAAARQHAEGSLEKGIPAEYENAAIQHMEHFFTDEKVATARTSMAPDLAKAKGVSEQAAADYLAKADARELALVHWVLYGKQVKDFNVAHVAHVDSIKGHLDNARRAGDAAEVERLEGVLADAERYTLVNESTLTRQDAQTVLAAITPDNEAARQAALAAVDQFDQLNDIWGVKGLEADAIRKEMKAHLTALLEKPGSLIEIVPKTKLHSRLVASLSDRYRVGLAPEDVWGITRAEDGTIIGANTFVPAMSDIQTSLSRGLSWYDRVKQGLAGPITGARLHAENKLRMRHIGAEEFGLSKRESDTLFNAINKHAIVQSKGARAFGAHELNEIAKDAHVALDPALQAKYGERAVLELVLQSFEGEFAMRGLSSGLSDRIKSRFGRLPMGDNLLGKIAEDWYPKLRFSGSPIFLAMEWVEGPFFAVLRGIKPGWRYTRDDIRKMSILRTIAPDFAENGAGIGRAQLAYGDQQTALRIAEASLFTKTWNKIMPQRMQRNTVRIKGPRAVNVYDLKKLLYARQAADGAAQRFIEALKLEDPSILRHWEAAADSTNPVDVWMTYMEERGAFDPSARHSLHVFDAMKPDSMGTERLRIGDIAHFHGFNTGGMLRGAVQDGTLTRDQFMGNYKRVGANTKFAERAWTVLNGFTENEWEVALRDALGVEAATGAINFHKLMAKMSNMSVDEFLNTQYGKVAELVDKASEVPVVALRQSIDDTLALMDVVPQRAGDVVFDRAKGRSRELLPTTEQYRTGGKDGVGTPAVLDVGLGERGVAAGKGRPPAEASHQKGLLSDNINDRNAAYQAMIDRVSQAMGGDIKEQLTAARWYDEMTTLWLGLTSKMTDSQIDAFLRQWALAAPEGVVGQFSREALLGGEGLVARLSNLDNEAQNRINNAIEKAYEDGTLKKKTKAELMAEIAAEDAAEPDGLRAMLGLTDEDTAAIKNEASELRKEAESELAARLNIAFAGSQQNSSVLGGMTNVYKMLDEIAKGTPSDGLKVTRFGMEGVTKRITNLLKDFGDMPVEMLGLKLSDFNDSLAGNTVRTLNPEGTLKIAMPDGTIREVPLQPAAMDVWMVRVFNFPDKTYFDRLVVDAMRRIPDKAQAEAAVLKDHGWKREELRDISKPDANQYMWMLERTNEMMVYANDTKLLGKSDWTAAEIQAYMWVGEQKAINYGDAPVSSVMGQAGSQVLALGDEPRVRPTDLQLAKMYKEEGPAVQRSVHQSTVQTVAMSVSEQTNTLIARSIAGAGAGRTSLLITTPAAATDFASRMAVALDQPMARLSNSNPTHATVDLTFDIGVAPERAQLYLGALTEYLEQNLTNNKYTQVITALDNDGRIQVRALKQSAGIPKAVPVPEDIIAKLQDGSWVKDIPDTDGTLNLSAEAMPLEFGQSKAAFEVITPEQGRKNIGADESAVRESRKAAEDAADRAYADYAPEAFESSERIANGAREELNQRQPGTGRRKGNVRAGFKPATAAEKAALYFINNTADATSGIHESFHLFVRLIDSSARRELLDGYNAAHGLTGRAAKRGSIGPDGEYRLTVEVEEWIAAEFEAFAAGDHPPTATYAATFKGFAEWGKAHPGIRRGSVVSSVFDKVLESYSDIPAGFTSLDERRIWESARVALMKAEDEAHSTAYYRRGPNWMMRSMNHPYMGLYPASYMWGKVLPELGRFLLRKPFGLKAPLGGLMMYNHVHRNIAMQLQTDEGLNQYIEDHPDTARFLTMMLPGNPVEMPVNLPVVARRAMEHDAENRARSFAGKEPEPFDLAGSVGDMLSYSVGYAQLGERVGDMFGEWMNQDGPNAGKVAPTVNPDVFRQA